MKLFSPDIQINNFYDKGRYLLAWRISIVFAIIFTLITILYGVVDSFAMIPSFSVVTVAVACALFLKKTKKYRPVFLVYAIAGTAISHFGMNFVLTFTHYVDFLWMAAVLLISFIGLGWKKGILFIFINAILIAYFFAFTLNHHIEILTPKVPMVLLGEYLEILLAFFVLAYLMRIFVIFQTHAEKELTEAYSSLEDQNTLILAKNKENETLIKEIHHRIKNNLQIIVSLLRMQSNEIENEDAKQHFKEAINRVMTMSLIHQKLYTEKDFSSINIKSYFDELVTDIVSSSSDNQIGLEIKTNVLNIDLDTIVPLGLIVNELVSNSLKHAFNEGDEKTIFIEINESPEEYRMTYQDNGIWKEKMNKVSSFGLELIDILTEQLNGEKILDTTNGTKYAFIFKRAN